MSRTRGFIDLAFDAVDGTSSLVERIHATAVQRTARRLAPFGSARSLPTLVTGLQTAISTGVCGSIRTINGIARRSLNAAADLAERDAPESSTPHPLADAVQSSLNGFLGDAVGSRLDLGMSVRDHGRPVQLTRPALARAIPEPTTRICVFIHGLAATERLWWSASEEQYGEPGVSFGSRLRDDLDFTPIFIRYNTGRHVSENGRALVALLGELLDAYPGPIEEIVLVGHSMGGLVARSAAHYAREQRAAWLPRLRHVVCIASPHLGAPLEQAANLLAAALRRFDTAGTEVPAELLERRSAGIKDLRHGYTVDEEWDGHDPDALAANNRRDLPLVDGVGYSCLAATISRDPDHPLGRLVGDLLVRLPSATGAATVRARSIEFHGGAVFPRMHHTAIVNHPDVYSVLRDLLSPSR